MPRVSNARAWYVVGVFAALSVLSYLDRLALGLLIEPLKADIHITDSQVGLLMGPAFSLVYAIALFPIAWAIDRSVRKWVVIGGVVLWSLATLASAFSKDFTTLFALRMGVGVGEAVLTPAAISLIGDLFVRERRPTPAAVMVAASSAGGGVSFILVAALLSAVAAGALPLPPALADLPPWRIVLFLAGLPGLVIALVMTFTLREPVRGGMIDPAAPVLADAFISPFKAFRFYVPFLLGMNATSMMLYVTAIWFPTHLIRSLGEQAETVGYIYGLVAMFGGMFGALFLPMVSERIALKGRKDALLLMALGFLPIAAAAFWTASGADSFRVAIIAIGVFQFFATAIVASPNVVIASLAGPRSRGRLTAANLVVQGTLAASIGPALVGYLSDHVTGGDIGRAMTFVALVILPAALALIALSYPSYREAVRRLAV